MRRSDQGWQYRNINNVPGKLICYAAAGKPILADVNEGNDVFELLHVHRAGLASSNDESILLLNARMLADDKNLRDELGANGKALASKLFSVHTAAQQIVALEFSRRAAR